VSALRARPSAAAAFDLTLRGKEGSSGSPIGWCGVKSREAKVRGHGDKPLGSEAWPRLIYLGGLAAGWHTGLVAREL
jgi:hypothetical protein